MPPALIAGVATVGGALISSSGAKKAANQQAESNAQAIAEQRRQFDRVQQLLSPYVQAGNQGLSSLLALAGAGGVQGGTMDWRSYLANNPDVAAEAQRAIATGQFTTPEEYAQFHYGTYGQQEGRMVPTVQGVSAMDAQRQAVSQFEQSPMFQAIARQGENAILQNASATGGLRGGNVQGALAQFRPALLNQQIQQQLQTLGGLASMGQNAAAGVGNAGIQTGANVGNLMQDTGQARGYGALASGALTGQSIASLGNIIGNAFGSGGNLGGLTANQIMSNTNASIAANPIGIVPRNSF